MIAKYPLRAITQAPHARAISALLTATLAVLIDPIFRFGDTLVKRIPTPPDEGWGVSRPVGKDPKSER